MRQLKPEEFPSLLREIMDPPEKLYIKGNYPSEDSKFLCVVGSRAASPYGKETCEKLILGLRGYPVVIVSGLALGIDSIAHRAALEAGLTTIAIPGSGLGEKVLYPAAHKGLAKQILEAGGALLSPFEENFEATPYSFPERNRIMAGLSHAVLVIEAAEKSGTLITSRLATEYNRDVLTVPGSIFSKQSYGPHMLIRLGATPIRGSADLLEALGLSTQEKLAADLAHLSKEEQTVLSLLTSPLPREELIEQLHMPIREANVLLSAMEIKGVITEKLGEIHSA